MAGLVIGQAAQLASVYARARRMRGLAQRAMEFSIDGPRADVTRALGVLEMMRRELAGEPGGEIDDG